MFLKRRVKRKSRVLCFLLIITACAGFYILNLNGWQWYQMVEQDICITPDHEMKDLRKLIQDSHRILKKFNLTHVVVYGRFVQFDQIYSIPLILLRFLQIFKFFIFQFNLKFCIFLCKVDFHGLYNFFVNYIFLNYKLFIKNYNKFS